MVPRNRNFPVQESVAPLTAGLAIDTPHRRYEGLIPGQQTNLRHPDSNRDTYVELLASCRVVGLKEAIVRSFAAALLASKTRMPDMLVTRETRLMSLDGRGRRVGEQRFWGDDLPHRLWHNVCPSEAMRGNRQDIIQNEANCTWNEVLALLALRKSTHLSVVTHAYAEPRVREYFLENNAAPDSFSVWTPEQVIEKFSPKNKDEQFFQDVILGGALTDQEVRRCKKEERRKSWLHSSSPRIELWLAGWRNAHKHD